MTYYIEFVTGKIWGDIGEADRARLIDAMSPKGERPVAITVGGNEFIVNVDHILYIGRS